MRIAQLIVLLLSVSVVTTPQFAIPQTLEELIEQGKAAQTAKKYSQAEAIFRQIIELNL